MANLVRIELLLARHADVAWTEVIRPWLLESHGQLGRSYVIVPTRGHAQGLKQRCLLEDLPLLGVEFLSPGLARKKWVALNRAPGHDRPAIGRELLLLGLRAQIERRLATLAPDDSAWGFWKSLQSDPERALDDFDELLKAGFRAADFPLAPLREVFGELVRWVDDAGYVFAPVQTEAAALTPLDPGMSPVGGRQLVYGLGAEMWGEFFNVAAFVRHCPDVTVVLPDPSFHGRTPLDEQWISLWRALLGVEPRTLDARAPRKSCEPVGALWLRDGGSAARARVLVGKTRAAEMELVADEIARLLAGGAENIAVVFPRADAAHLRLGRLLAERGLPFVDQLEIAGQPPLDVQTQRALLAFHEGGGRLEDLLALWPLLRALGAVTCPLGAARDVCERVFDERPTHSLETHLPRLLASERAEWREVARVAAKLLPAWPAELTLHDALARFQGLCDAFSLETPAGWSTLDAFAERVPAPLPLKVVLGALGSFLAENSAVPGAPGRGVFARVTLTTRRSSEGLAWSHLILVESNAGVWPERRPPSCWLTDEQREDLNRRSRFSLGLFTGEHRATLERLGYATLARDTRREVIFTAALYDEEEPELKLAPNSWLERVLWDKGLASEGLERGFEVLAIDAGPPAPRPDLDPWHAVWTGRRDPARPFDEYFFAGDPLRLRPERLAARQIERGVQDPAELWFETILGVKRVDWSPLVRVRAKVVGQLAHALLAEALTPEARRPGRDRIGRLPPRETAERALRDALETRRELWPDDHYWRSFHGELVYVCERLIEEVYALPGGEFIGTELNLPAGATIPLGETVLPVRGRMDLVRLDREEWLGATVNVIDFKTGGDAKLAARRMGDTGASLQLGVYLAATMSLGARTGAVTMLKPEPGGTTTLRHDELPEALALLARLERFLATGIYGALTPDRSAYAHAGFAWPLACTPVARAVLEAKFARTFGAEPTASVEEDEP